MAFPEHSTELATRLAHKTGLSAEEAQSFLDAFSDIISEGESGVEGMHFAHVTGIVGSFEPDPAATLPEAIAFPLTQDERGRLIVPPASRPRTIRWPAKKRRTLPGLPPMQPPKPKGPAPGAYPGPSTVIRDPLPLDEQSAGGGYPGPSIAYTGGAYPGPSVLVAIRDPHGAPVHLGQLDLESLADALGKATSGKQGSY